MRNFFKAETAEERKELKNFNITIAILLLISVLIFAFDPILDGVDHLMKKKSNLYEYASAYVNNDNNGEYKKLILEKSAENFENTNVTFKWERNSYGSIYSVHTVRSLFSKMCPEYIRGLGDDRYFTATKYEAEERKYGCLGMIIDSKLDTPNADVLVEMQILLPAKTVSAEEMKNSEFYGRISGFSAYYEYLKHTYQESFGEYIPIFYQTNSKFEHTKYIIVLTDGVFVMSNDGSGFVKSKDFVADGDLQGYFEEDYELIESFLKLRDGEKK